MNCCLSCPFAIQENTFPYGHNGKPTNTKYNFNDSDF